MTKKTVLLGVVWDIGLPAAVYYGARGLGYDVLPALVAGALAAVIRVGYVAVVRRRLDGLAAVVGGTFGVLLIVSLLTGDPRILLAKESVLSGAAGLLLVGSCLVGKPIVYTLARKVHAGKAEQLAQWDEQWQTQPAFRKHFMTLTAGFGVVLLVDAVVRVVLIYSLPVDLMANLSPVLHIAALAVLGGWAMVYKNRRRIHAT